MIVVVRDKLLLQMLSPVVVTGSGALAGALGDVGGVGVVPKTRLTLPWPARHSHVGQTNPSLNNFVLTHRHSCLI